VAEHVSDEKRGYYTGWLQTSPTLGIVLSLAVIIACRHYFGNAVFEEWAWRVPFLVSFLLVAIAIYIRLQLQETPIFQEIQAKGQTSRNPWKEAFLSANIKFVLIASIVVIGEGVVWYSGQFWALYFLQQVSKVDPLTTAYIVGAALLIGTPTLIFYGWLSDHIGRKPVILGGFVLAAVTYYPLYLYLGAITQPGNINYVIAVIVIGILVSYVCMVYGPIGAFLAEYFPSRIRYTSVSVPYHIGNGWGGGLVPLITTAALPGHWQHRVRAALSDLGACGVLRAQPIPDAGDPAHQHLERSQRGQSNSLSLIRPSTGPSGPVQFFQKTPCLPQGVLFR